MKSFTKTEMKLITERAELQRRLAVAEAKLSTKR
jgi:hypothetical protein